MDSRSAVKWLKESSLCLLNPKAPPEEQNRLMQLAEKFALKNHIWIASSGSSSESTESAKLIALSEEALLVSAEAVNRHLQAEQKDIWVQVLPRFHVGGLSIEARAFLSRSKIISGLDEHGKWSAQFFNDSVERTQASLSALVPTQVWDLVKAHLPAPKSLRAVVVGGSALSVELSAQARSLGWPLLQSYGMTECSSQIATARLNSNNRDDSKLQLLSHVEAKLSTGGYLKIKSKALLTGYAQWRQQQAIWVDPKFEGWFETSDLAEIEDGHLTSIGRGGEYIKISGEGVQLGQLQEKLETIIQTETQFSPIHFAIFSIPDSRSEYKIVLAVANSLQAEVQNLVQSFNSKVAPYEKIQQVFLIDAIPRTELGKIARKKLRSMI